MTAVTYGVNITQSHKIFEGHSCKHTSPGNKCHVMTSSCDRGFITFVTASSNLARGGGRENTELYMCIYLACIHAVSQPRTTDITDQIPYFLTHKLLLTHPSNHHEAIPRRQVPVTSLVAMLLNSGIVVYPENTSKTSHNTACVTTHFKVKDMRAPERTYHATKKV